MSESMDTLPVRMIDVIDALPVPAGPGGLRPRARLILRPRLDPVTVVVVIVLALAAVAATPVGRAAVSEAGRLIERLFGLGPWPVYYGVITVGPNGDYIETHMFWDGASAGRPTGIVSPPGSVPRGTYRGGYWSPDGAAIALSTGSAIYVGDRSGAMREVANVAPLRVMVVEWVGPNRIAAIAREGEETDWLITVDPRSGEISRALLPKEAQPARRPGLLGVTELGQFGQLGPSRMFSEEGRWLITGDRPCRSVAVYDLASDRRIELADGVEKRGLSLGWLRGTVLVWGICDLEAGLLRIFAGAPDARATEIGQISVDLESSVDVVSVDRAHDRVLYSGKDGDDWIVWAITPNGQQEQLARLAVRIESPIGSVDPVRVSSDGRLLAVHVIDYRKTGYADTEENHIRAAMVDLGTGEIMWACDDAVTGCARLEVR